VSGQALSLIGTWVETVAQALLVLRLTHSGVILGLTTAAAGLRYAASVPAIIRPLLMMMALVGTTGLQTEPPRRRRRRSWQVPRWRCRSSRHSTAIRGPKITMSSTPGRAGCRSRSPSRWSCRPRLLGGLGHGRFACPSRLHPDGSERVGAGAAGERHPLAPSAKHFHHGLTATYIDLASRLVTWSLTAHSARRLTASVVGMAAGAFLGDLMLSHAHRYAPVAPAAVTAVVIVIAWVALKPRVTSGPAGAQRLPVQQAVK
jgi:hypothetical protein